jgi:hypothetical protein
MNMRIGGKPFNITYIIVASRYCAYVADAGHTHVDITWCINNITRSATSVMTKIQYMHNSLSMAKLMLTANAVYDR